MSATPKSSSASRAAASRCSTVLVDPPIATSSATAFSNAGRDAMARGSTDGVVVVVVALREVHDQRAGPLEQRLAGGVRGQRGAVAGQRQADRLGQAVHRVGGEHAGAGAAGRAGGALDGAELLVGDRVVGGGDHRVDQVQLRVHDAVDRDGLAGLHRAAGDEHGRDVQAQRGQQHARRDLVAVGDADQRVRAVRVDHVLHRVGDQLPAGQRVEHAAVAHGDAVVDRDRVELAPDAAGLGHRVGDQRTEVAQVYVPGNELGEAVGDGDDRLAEVGVGHAGGAPQRAGAGHHAAVSGGLGAQFGHTRQHATHSRRSPSPVRPSVHQSGLVASAGRESRPAAPGSPTASWIWADSPTAVSGMNPAECMRAPRCRVVPSCRRGVSRGGGDTCARVVCPAAAPRGRWRPATAGRPIRLRPADRRRGRDDPLGHRATASPPQ